MTPSGVPVHVYPQDLPLLIVLNRDASDWGAIIQRAADMWNAELGTPVFIYAGPIDVPPPTGSGIIIVAIDAEKHDGAQTTYLADSLTGIMSHTVITMPTGRFPSAAALLMARHELGHCLGLTHDGDKESLMYPSITPLDTHKRVTDADIRRLRQMYVSPDQDKDDVLSPLDSTRAN